VRKGLTPEELERTTYYRKRFELGLNKTERDAIVAEAAKEMGITPDSVRHRWHRLGMCKKWSFMEPVVLKAVAKYPFDADRTLAAKYNVNFSSFGHARIRLGIPPSTMRRRAALRKEVAIYVRDYPELTAAEVRDSIKADGDHPWRFSVHCISELMSEVYDERAAS
tara:strand:- start:396 stop:893 length:498 start_codon:yes stop_codon:yes gene_type:complete